MLRTSQGVRARVTPSQSITRIAMVSSKAARVTQDEDRKEGSKKAEQNATESVKNPSSTKKTLAQMDEDMRRAMEGLAGDGGEAGLELEDGKAVSMKRGVRENMFRYI